MIFHHILLDLVSDFGKGPQKGVKTNILFFLFSARWRLNQIN